MAKIRPGTPDDAAGILEIHKSAIMSLGRTAYSDAECESWAADLRPQRYVEAMTDGERYLLAETEGSPRAFCSFKDNEVIGLYVHFDVSRRGVGSVLLAEAEARIAAGGHSHVRLTAALSALSFYRAHGYEVVARKRWKTRGGLEIEVCDMTKTLDPTLSAAS